MWDKQKYKHYLFEKGLRLQTIEVYIDFLESFLSNNEFTYENCLDFLHNKKEEGLLNSSINKYISFIKSYARFLELEWVDNLKKWKEQESYIALMSDKEVEEFLSLPCPPQTPIRSWKQWTVYYSIMAFSAMRPGEVAKIRIQDIDLSTNNFILIDTKTTPRRVPIAENIKALVIEWLKVSDNYLFPPARLDSNKPFVTASAWRDHFNRRVSLMGIKKPFLKPYSLRHSWVTDMISNGVDITKAGKVAGHRNIKTTMKYTHLTNKDIQDIINKHTIIQNGTSDFNILNALKEYIEKSGIKDRQDIYYEITRERVLVEIRSKK